MEQSRPGGSAGECPGDDVVAALIEGSLDPAVRTRINAHLDACADCRRLIAAAAAGTTSGASAEPFAGAAPPLDAGDRVARYEILGEVGAGGMGIVYAARDPELGRRVAVKVLWPTARDGARSEQHRILREARSMARLAHPNVVRVYDVGVSDGRVFVVMEFVEGTTLRRWLAEGPRPVRDVLRVLIAAGRGLAAAHAAGLVHRDFKPDNVLLGDGGRALVTDFGLAVAPAPDEPAAESARGRPPDSGALRSRSGSIAGTPAYMAPEQMKGGAVDARSDVWSYCATLHEALYGRRAFPGRTVAEIRSAIERGPPPEPPARRGVPPWIRRVVLQGLERDPERRPRSMEALLAELERDPGAPRRRALGATALVLAVALGAGAAVRASRASARVCAGAERKLEGVWDGARKEAARAAFVAGGQPWAAPTWERVAEALDDYARGWTAARTEACEATHVSHTQSEALLDLRVRCLDLRLEELRATVDLLSRPDAGILRSAARATRQISPVRACADTEALLSPVLPADAEARSQVEALRRELADVRARKNLGLYQEGSKRAADIVARARPLGYEPLLAEALHASGVFLDLVGDAARGVETLKEGVWAAERGRDRKLAARILADLVLVEGHEASKREQAHEHARHAAAIVAALGGDADIEAMIANGEGAVLVDEGRYPEAEARFREASEKALAAVGPRDPRYGLALENLAVPISWEARYAEGLELQEKAIAVYRGSVGEHHPLFGVALFNSGDNLRQLGRLPEARARAERALALFTEVLGPEHRLVGSAEHVLGLCARDEGKLEEAEQRYARAAAIAEKTRGPNHVFVANYVMDRAELLLRLARPREAEALCRRAEGILAKAGSEVQRARAEVCVAAALLDQGDTKSALATASRALAAMEAEARPAEPSALAVARFVTARALVATRGDAARARLLAEQAIAGYTAVGSPAIQAELTAARAFVASLGPPVKR